ncbi:MAG: alpha-1,2-fucosyltransferase [Cyclobacteriaceae bacterium]
MIGVDVFGQMGNQMFQYAFAFNAAKTLNADFFIDELTFRFCLPDYFEMPHFNVLLNRLKRKSIKALTTMSNEKNKIRFSNENTPDIRLLANWKHYWGYFQSEIFFEQNEELIKKEFRIRKEHIERFEAINPVAKRKLLVIHVRLKDYVDSSFCLPTSYYINCYLNIPNKEDLQVIVVSDDLDGARQKFKEYKRFEYYSNESIQDFILIMMADYAIISNSTFSWWAAYLNPKPDKKIMAPKNWLGARIGKERPNGIMTMANQKWDWTGAF